MKKFFLAYKFFLLPLPAVFFLSCSFNYTDKAQEDGAKYPDMVFSEIQIRRHENTTLRTEIFANTIEFYAGEQVWAGENVRFTQYDEKDNSEVLRGTAGFLLASEKENEFRLGNKVAIEFLKDKLSAQGTAFVWKKNEHTLLAPENGIVSIKKENEIAIEGKGFVADSQAKTFAFQETVSGTIYQKEQKAEEASDTEKEQK
ncbi:hypothetical protein [Treponema phagedenis]|uniref:hypothetical protein n=1 Tax=Treponema phagedenis TaxID=162 RepID=UPI0001F63C19|nr:hypothetical protein [Treponema phagedenis]EFW38058.1 hypothetical protein HMPREF9554_01433 [Treponema phagedenis F0421]TYT78438.1 LPS export ABC transporter periplasmic protein LptC [Treponema phagedenis]